MSANANYTIQELRGKIVSSHVDHVVELQLITAVLNKLPKTEYDAINLRKLIGFFAKKRNLQVISDNANLRKGRAVRRLILARARPNDHRWLTQVKGKWNQLAPKIPANTAFKNQMNLVLASV